MSKKILQFANDVIMADVTKAKLVADGSTLKLKCRALSTSFLLRFPQIGAMRTLDKMQIYTFSRKCNGKIAHIMLWKYPYKGTVTYGVGIHHGGRRYNVRSRAEGSMPELLWDTVHFHNAEER